MRAARLHAGEHELRLEDVAVPNPVADQVLVRVAGAGVCHSDLHVIDGILAEYLRLPVTMGHEIAGRVERVGQDVGDLGGGEPVVVMVGWGCGHCYWCVSGHEQLCPEGDEAGSTVDGGFAEYVLVPHRRHLVLLGDLEPLAATPLGCAALSAYAAVKRVRSRLVGGTSALVIGAGGLGQYAVEFLRMQTAARVVTVDARDKCLEIARSLGADDTIRAGDAAADEILELAEWRGADAVLDFVGTDESLRLAAAVVTRRGIIAMLGLAGGSFPFGFYSLAPESALTTVYAGTIADLHEVVAIARTRGLATRIRTYPLDSVNHALDDLRAGRVEGRAALVPG